TGTFHPVPAFGFGTYMSRRLTSLSPINQNGKGNHDITKGGIPDYSQGSLPFMITPAAGNCNPAVLNSPHTAAMIVGLGDGSVRTVSSSISVTTWRNACIPDDGNVLGNDW